MFKSWTDCHLESSLPHPHAAGALAFPQSLLISIPNMSHLISTTVLKLHPAFVFLCFYLAKIRLLRWTSSLQHLSTFFSHFSHYQPHLQKSIKSCIWEFSIILFNLPTLLLFPLRSKEIIFSLSNSSQLQGSNFTQVHSQGLVNVELWDVLSSWVLFSFSLRCLAVLGMQQAASECLFIKFHLLFLTFSPFPLSSDPFHASLFLFISTKCFHTKCSTQNSPSGAENEYLFLSTGLLLLWKMDLYLVLIVNWRV